MPLVSAIHLTSVGQEIQKKCTAVFPSGIAQKKIEAGESPHFGEKRKCFGATARAFLSKFLAVREPEESRFRFSRYCDRSAPMDQTLDIANLRVLRFAEEGSLLRSGADANDFIGAAWGCEADLLAIPTARLGPNFLDLATKVAGEVFQKFVNYRLRCAIVGDISTSLDRSRALRDFVRETNEGKSIWFVADFEELRARLEGTRVG